MEGGHIRWHQAECGGYAVDDGVLLSVGEDSLPVDGVLLATGFESQRPGGSLVDELVESALSVRPPSPEELAKLRRLLDGAGPSKESGKKPSKNAAKNKERR